MPPVFYRGFSSCFIKVISYCKCLFIWEKPDPISMYLTFTNFVQPIRRHKKVHIAYYYRHFDISILYHSNSVNTRILFSWYLGLKDTVQHNISVWVGMRNISAAETLSLSRHKFIWIIEHAPVFASVQPRVLHIPCKALPTLLQPLLGSTVLFRFHVPGFFLPPQALFLPG